MSFCDKDNLRKFKKDLFALKLIKLTSINESSLLIINSSKTSSITLRAGGGISGEVSVPGDKSISHRSLLFGGIAEGVTTVEEWGHIRRNDYLCD